MLTYINLNDTCSVPSWGEDLKAEPSINLVCRLYCTQPQIVFHDSDCRVPRSLLVTQLVVLNCEPSPGVNSDCFNGTCVCILYFIIMSYLA